MAGEGTLGRWITIGVAVVATLGVVTYGVTLKNNAQPTQNLVHEQQLTRAQMIEYQKYAAYDGHTVSGSALVTSVRKYADNPVFNIYLKKKAGTSGNYLIWTNPSNSAASSSPAIDWSTKQLNSSSNDASSKFLLADITSATHAYYVAPSSRYTATLVKRGTKVVGVAFEEL